jgi:hypothetical protein
MMDLSQTYINMCTASAELQRMWEPAACDYVFCRVDQSVSRIMSEIPKVRGTTHYFTSPGSFHGAECCGTKIEHTWLPLAGQIQDFMRVGPGVHFVDANKRFLAFAGHMRSSTLCQMWLRYFMAIRGRKSWNFKTCQWDFNIKAAHGDR